MGCIYIYIYTTLLPAGSCPSAVYLLTMSNTSFCACSGLYQVFPTTSLLLNSAETNSAKTLAFDLRRASLLAQSVKNHLQCRRPQFDSWVGKMPWRRDKLPTPVFLGFPCGSAGKESACNLGDWVKSLGWEDSPGEGKDTPLQCSGPREFYGLYSPWGRKVRKSAHGVAKSDMTERLLLDLRQIWLKFWLHHSPTIGLLRAYYTVPSLSFPICKTRCFS